MNRSQSKLLSLLLAFVLVVSTVGYFNLDTTHAAAKKIHVKKTTINLNVSKTYQQKLIDKKGKTINATKVKWKSAKPSIAKINKKGKITAVKKGTAKMTAKYKGKTYKFTVTVICKHGKKIVKNKIKATCSHDGYTGDTCCAICGIVLSKGNAIPMTDHPRTVVKNQVEATCSQEGYTGDVCCAICNAVINKGEAIPKTDHPITILKNKIEATCIQEGYTGDTCCAVCDAIIEKGEAVPKSDHIYDKNGKCNVCEGLHPDATQYIEFHDTFLEKSIKDSLGLTMQDAVSLYQLNNLLSVEIPEGVKDIQDLKYATSLKNVRLSSATVKNLEVLSPLPIVDIAIFYLNDVMDLSFMKNMSSIRTITCHLPFLEYDNLKNMLNGKALDTAYLYVSSVDVSALQNACINNLYIYGDIEGDNFSALETIIGLKFIGVKRLTQQQFTDEQLAVFERLIKKGVDVSLF